MRPRLYKKAFLVTVVLSLLLLGLGFEFGWYFASRQVDEANMLTSQATEKVLALTRERQALEEKLQELSMGGGGMLAADTRPGEVWHSGNLYYGLARQGGKVVFNRNLTIGLLGLGANQAMLRLNWQGRQQNASLMPGEKLTLPDNRQVALYYLGQDWVILALQTE